MPTRYFVLISTPASPGMLTYVDVAKLGHRSLWSLTELGMHGCVVVLHLSVRMTPMHRWKKAMDAVHRAKLLLLLADFAGAQSAVPSIVARYKVIAHTHLPFKHTEFSGMLQPSAKTPCFPQQVCASALWLLLSVNRLSGVLHERLPQCLGSLTVHA